MKIIKVTSLIIVAFALQSLVVRHDVPDEKFIELAKHYPQICHFEMGEGTLIASQWILTAGHIGNDLQRDMESGKNPFVTCNGQPHSIEGVFVHPDFKSMSEGLNNDICLVKIKTAVTHVTPVKVYSKKDESGKHITLVGSGDVGTGKVGPQKWDKITRAATNVIDGVDPHWIFFLFDPPESKQATAYEGISGPGDSGGPALAEFGNDVYIVGVSSFQKGQEQFGKGRYGVTEYYARVSAYSKWIDLTMMAQTKALPKVNHTEENKDDKLNEYVGDYGFRKIVVKNNALHFQRDEEPLILMKEIGKDLFLWEDGNTKLQFVRNADRLINGFEIRRMNGEVVKVNKNR